jgi:hypothetical protein
MRPYLKKKQTNKQTNSSQKKKRTKERKWAGEVF